MSKCTILLELLFQFSPNLCTTHNTPSEIFLRPIHSHICNNSSAVTPASKLHTHLSYFSASITLHLNYFPPNSFIIELLLLLVCYCVLMVQCFKMFLCLNYLFTRGNTLPAILLELSYCSTCTTPSLEDSST